MPLIYITGPTGSGKSTICEELRAKGFSAYDTDEKEMRTLQFIDDRQLLVLDEKVIRKIYSISESKPTFICGTSPNDLDFRELFAKIIVLTIEEAEQQSRIISRTNNSYGKEPHQLANALKWRSIQIEKYKSVGAIAINASQPIDKTVSQILSIVESGSKT